MMTASAAALATAVLPDPARSAAPLLRPIPSTGETIPALGLGTWVEFNVGSVMSLRNVCLEVTRRFIAQGGGMIDSSPMYGTAEEVVGWSLARLERRGAFFSASKVWTPAGGGTEEQLARSEALWGLKRFDLMQVHNLVDWREHLAALTAAKAEGRLRYVGITTSHGLRHAEMAEIMAKHPVDFVQFTYNVLDREAERRLLPLAADRGIAVIVNRPFRRGGLFGHVGNAPLPSWAAEFGAGNWAQVFLKYILAHPAVTCAIPATSVPAHIDENMGALTGPLPDTAMRRRIVEHVESL